MKKSILLIVALTTTITATVFAGGMETWSYSGDTGPDKWGQLSPTWVACGIGHYQSPIDIRDALKAPKPEQVITLDHDLSRRAARCIERMFELAA